jgi:hypothetical protein
MYLFLTLIKAVLCVFLIWLGILFFQGLLKVFVPLPYAIFFLVVYLWIFLNQELKDFFRWIIKKIKELL